MYRLAGGAIEIEDVGVMPAALIPDDDIPRTGCTDRAAVWSLAGAHTHTAVGPETLLHRVQFRYHGAPPVRQTAESVADDAVLARRLDDMDRRSRRGPWTLAVLRLIASSPGVPARVLAAEIGWDTRDFKARVRRLKAIGLTASQPVGYELTASGRRHAARVAGSEGGALAGERSGAELRSGSEDDIDRTIGR